MSVSGFMVVAFAGGKEFLPDPLAVHHTGPLKPILLFAVPSSSKLDELTLQFGAAVRVVLPKRAAAPIATPKPKHG